MRGFSRLRSLAFALLVVCALRVEAAPVFGSYIGYLKHDRLGRTQIAKLDFLFAREDSSRVNLSAVLTLQFGGFESGEYVSYHFDRVEFNLLTGQLVFDQADQNVFLATESFENGVLKARLSSVFTGDVGELVLTTAPLAAPKAPLVEAISGEYHSTCTDEPNMVMQLNAVRSNDDTFQIGNPFGPYRIVGTVAQYGDLCLDFEDAANQAPCVISDVGTSSYNFFSGILSLVGKRRTFQCRVLEKGALDCGSCRFEKKVTTEGARRLKPFSVKPYFDTATPLPRSGDSVAGEYTGFVHHERLDTFQRVKVVLNTFQSLGRDGGVDLKLAANASLYFGDYDSPNLITYRFETISFPNPLFTRQFILSRPEGDLDAVLEVTQAGGGVLRGIWQSKLFGRLGTFEVRKKGLPVIPAAAAVMHDFSGFYQAPDWELKLAISLGRNPINSNNPFDPLKVGGYLRAPKFTGKLPITGSTYDFFSNRMALFYGDDGVLVLRTGPQGKIQMRRISNIYGSRLQSYQFEDFVQKPGDSR